MCSGESPGLQTRWGSVRPAPVGSIPTRLRHFLQFAIISEGGLLIMDEGFSKLKGYSYPLTPGGRSSIVGDFPWHYGTEYLNILYRANPDAIAAYLPYPLEPGPQPDLAYVAFSRW